jgi:hypothetical protein
MKLKGNESATENWHDFFQTGGNGSHGYSGCYPNTGQGPCDKLFKAEECEYYPGTVLIQYIALQKSYMGIGVVQGRGVTPPRNFF